MAKIKFSIVIALAPWRDAEILTSIKKLDYPRSSYEVIIGKGLNVCDNRNNGASKAKGEVIIFLDDDGIIESNYLREVDKFFKIYKDVDVLGGPQLTPKGDKIFARASGYALGSLFGSGAMSRRYSKAKLTVDADSSYISGANLICKKEVFRKIKFDRNFYPGDDVNFVRLAKLKGFKVAYSPQIIIYHRRRDRVTGLIKQIYDYAYVRSSESIAIEILKRPSIIVPSAFLIYLVLLPIFVLISSLFLIPLAFYALLNIVFSSYASIRNNEAKAVVIIMLIFFVIHIIYGAGIISGALRRLLNFGK